MKTEKEIKSIVEQLTLEEKAGLCSGLDFWHLKGVERLGIPSIMVTDGPSGLRKQIDKADHVGLNDSVPATCFPAAATTASSWDPELLRDIGVAVGRECQQEDVAVVLGPGVNIKRSPLGGRNFEYFSEDPYLAGQLGAAWVDGVQSQGVGTSLKHFAANNQESHRMVVDTILDERSLREIYLPAFEKVVESSQPWTVMCSYNKLNGTYLSKHREMLTDILKREWGHRGLVVTDWGATDDRVEGLKAGVELEMPGSGGFNDRAIVEAVRTGALDVAILDEAALRVLTLIFRSIDGRKRGTRYDREAHHLLCRRAAEESMVLLKNDAGILPLKPEGRIAVIGELAEKPRYQGAGSSKISPTKIDKPLDSIRELLGSSGSVCYARGYDLAANVSYAALIEEAVHAAASAASVIAFIGLPPTAESEGFDREHMRLPTNQLELVDRLLDARPDTVIVLQNGSPVELPFAFRAKTILESYLGGQAGGSAVARVLFGLAAPGGKLAETFPLRLEDTPSYSWFPGQPRQVQYREGIWVGYRYYDSAGRDVAFPFGHGLSYTSFSYSDLRRETSGANGDTIEAARLGPRSGLKFSCAVKNEGKRGGWEIAQLYVSPTTSSAHRPTKELKAFAKVWLEAGASARVEFELGSRAFASWDAGKHDWAVESGKYSVAIGSSSRDSRLQVFVQVNGASVSRRSAALEPYYHPERGMASIDDEAYSALLGRPIPESMPTRPYTLNSTIGEIGATQAGKRLLAMLSAQPPISADDKADPTDKLMMQRVMAEAPLRSMLMMGGAAISKTMIDELLVAMNSENT
jgi:Beta-glucosidase-related glycosidases